MYHLKKFLNTFGKTLKKNFILILNRTTMSHSYSEHKYPRCDDLEKSGFCKLASDLIISFSGRFVDCVPNLRSGITGVILTRKGELLSRTSRCGHWQELQFPSVHLFFDCGTENTFLVDHCKHIIKQVEPCGRILDCTDRIIYEIKDCKWVPICNLADKVSRTIVRCSTISATATSVVLDTIGNFVEVLEFSEIPVDLVSVADGQITVSLPNGTIAPGGCAVLLYRTCFCGEELIVAHLIIRSPTPAPIVARFSAQAGTIAATPLLIPGGALPIVDPILAFLPPAASLAPIVVTDPLTGATNISPVTTWVERYDVPSGFDPITGIWTVPVTGDYQVNAVLTYDSPVAFPLFATVGVPPTAVIPRTEVPRFVLIRTRAGAPFGAPGEIVADAPVTADRLAGFDTGIVIGGVTVIIDTLDLAEVGQASINIGLRLAAGDTLRIFFVNDTNALLSTLPVPGIFGPGYILDPLGTTFNAHFLGPASNGLLANGVLARV